MEKSNTSQIQDYKELMKELRLPLKHPFIKKVDLEKCSYIIIRHGYSMQNYAEQKLLQTCTYESKEFQEFKRDPTLKDPVLHDIGIMQCEANQEQLNTINFKIVFTSPIQRCLMTTINMFKNHPNKDKIRFIVLPLAREIMRTFGGVPMNVHDLMEKYKVGSKSTHGINLDWSNIFLNGIPELWQVQVMTDFSRQQLVYSKLKQEKDGKTNFDEVISDIINNFEEDYETPKMVYDRAQKLKQFMKEFLRANPLNHEIQEKYALVAHGFIISALLTKGLQKNQLKSLSTSKKAYIDAIVFKNCQYEAFFNF